MRFELLGPMRVWHNHEPIRISAQREQILLAMLLLQVDHCVERQRLVEATWSDPRPRNAVAQLHAIVYRLRKRLTAAGVPDQVIATEPAGYRARVEPDHVDLWEFRRLRESARSAVASGHPETARHHYRASLALWRGAALAGIDSESIRNAGSALDDERLQAYEECIEVEIALGGGGELVAELTTVVRQHRYREGLHAALMQALYRAGRQADALTVYQQARRVLRDELGTEPGADLRRLHRAILNQEPSLGTPTHATAPWTTLAPPIPRQLPADIAGFAGRAEALKALDEVLPAGTADRSAPAGLSVIVGTAGVGKSALAVHWAHRVVDQFPGGQLYLNLRGFDPGDSPVDPAEAVRVLLMGLQVPAQRIPAGLDAQVGLYRSLLADRRVLVVLDNARDSEQVRPLLPGTPTCLTVVTSRNSLSGLVADGARLVALEVLALADARLMLECRLGADRVAAEADAADELIHRCARLPLALAIVSGRAAAHPHFSLQTLGNELRQVDSALEPLSDSDTTADIRRTFSWSYRALSAGSARLFRMLGLHPGPDIAASAAGSLVGLPARRAQAMLAELTRVSLLNEETPGRYTFHDLLRAYATELTNSHDLDEHRREAVRRLFDHYLHTAHNAARLVDPDRAPLALPPVKPGTNAEALASAEQALRWLTSEYPVLVRAVKQAVTAGLDSHAWQLAWALFPFLDRQGHWHDQAVIQQVALKAVESLSDEAGQAYIHRFIGRTCARLCRWDDAQLHLQQAFKLFGKLEHYGGQAAASTTLGLVYEQQHQYRDALRQFKQSLELARAANHRAGEASSLGNVGWAYAQLGDYRQTLVYCQQALDLWREMSGRDGHAAAWITLGYAHHRLGHYQEAVSCLQRALDLFGDTGDRHNRAEALIHLGDAHEDHGDHLSAQDAWVQALAILDDIGHPDAEDVRARLRGRVPVDPS